MLRLAEQNDVSKRDGGLHLVDDGGGFAHWHDHAVQAGVSQAGSSEIEASFPRICGK